MKPPAPKPRRSALRRLSDEEIALWVEVAKSVARRRGAKLPSAPQPTESPAAAAPPSRPQASPAPAPRRPALPPLAPLERGVKRALSRGRGAVDAALDLHGLNQTEAHHALRGFLAREQMRGSKLVIVVTGKGAPRDRDREAWIGEIGVLRRLAPHWLREADMRSVVLGFEEASRAHGGAGALYVRLRRREPR